MSKKENEIKLIRKIARGAFGEIYECLDTKNNMKMAIKLEKPNYNMLATEKKIYDKMIGPNTPKVYDHGKITFGDQLMNYMTMELLGPSLEKLFAETGRKFTEKTVFMIGKSCLARIEALHHNNYIHRDVKPDNFVTNKTRNKIYLIDFGLTKRYRNSKSHTHIPYKTGKNLTGTARYASVATHQGIEQSRRDDLESLGYMLVYFLAGKLPWQGLKAKNKIEKYESIKKVKEETSLFKLCLGLPNEIYLYLLHVKSIGFEESPDYRYLNNLFDNALESAGIEDDGIYDWMVE